MVTTVELLPRHPFLAGLPATSLDLVHSCASAGRFPTGEYVFREGEVADRFFLLDEGRVALETHAPGRPVHVLDSVGAGGVVGWSWLVPPHRWFCDGRVLDEVGALVVDGAALRASLQLNPEAGYEVLQRVAHIMYARLQSTRVRLLDLYGPPRGS
jgi:CRP/FNR family transcriptional regulator, cyclic AMP receptor protein